MVDEETYDTRLRVDPDDVIETIGAEDSRLRVIAEELANPLGKRILQLLSSQTLNTAQISAMLNETIQAIAYHIERMVEVGLVRVTGFEISPRGKDMKKYALRKTAILFVIDSKDKQGKELLKSLKRVALKRLYKRILSSLMVFIASYIVSNLLIELAIKKIAPDNIYRPWFPWEGTSMPLSPIEFLPLALGIMSTFITWYIFSRKLVTLDFTLHGGGAGHS